MRLERSPDRPSTLVAHPDLAAVATRLAAASRRARSNRGLAGLTLGASAGLLVLLALEIWRRLDPVGFGSLAGKVGLGAAPPFLQALAIAAVAALAIAIAALFALSRRARPPIAFARSADRVFELRERISTAIEVAGKGAEGPVARALIGDAASRAGAIRPERLEPVRLPRLAWAGLAALAFTAVLQFAPIALPSTASLLAAASPTPDLPPEPLPPAEQQAAAEEVTRIAALVAAEAEDRADPYLGAVGRTMAALGEDLATAETVDRNELLGELNRLLTHAEEAAIRPAAFPDIAAAPELIENLLREMTPPPQMAAAGELDFAAPAGAPAGADANTPANTVANPVAMIPPGPERGIGDGTNRPPLDVMEGNLGGIQIRLREAEDDEVVNQARTGGAAGANAQPGNMGVETNQPPGQGMVQGEGQVGPPQQAPGGATRQGENGGLDAGVAAQQPGGVGLPPPDADFEPDDGMLLEARMAAEGRRIRIEIPPPPQIVDMPVAEIPTPGAWRTLPETDVGRVLLGPAAGALVRRYFQPIPAETAP